MISDFSYVEYYVDNFVLAKFFYQMGLCFEELNPGDLFKNDDQNSILLQQQDINIILSSPVHANSSIYEFIKKHGSGVKDVAFEVSDVSECYDRAIKHGAVSIQQPTKKCINNEAIQIAKIQVYGDTIHSLINKPLKSLIKDPLLESGKKQVPSIFKRIDHLAICVNRGEMARWVDFYQHAFGFEIIHKEMINTGKTGMDSVAISSKNGTVKLVFTEPLPLQKKSQIDIFIDAYQGSGVQHIAFLTEDIISAVSYLQNRRVRFLRIPDVYYNNLVATVPKQFNGLIKTRIDNLF